MLKAHQHVVNQPPILSKEKYPAFSTQELLAEQNFFSCSPLWVREFGGPIAKGALKALERLYEVPIARAKKEGLSAVMDLRVHRLMPEQFPGIPGWHCDFVPRGAYSGQPNFSMCHSSAFHVALLLSDHVKGVSNTQFVNQPMKAFIYSQEHVYHDLHHEVDRIAPVLTMVPDGQFVWFNQKTIHRAMPAIHRGVRLFMRFSMIEKPVIVNQRTYQQQVYVLSEGGGW
jgi:hypothetical protein